MSVNIVESGLSFGPYEGCKLFHIEHSRIYAALGKGISTVEFILSRKDEEILFVEAKSSSPTPENKINFDTFIEDIHTKFVHALDIYFATMLKRLDDSNLEMPDCFRTADYQTAKIKFVLVINGHRQEWLPPLQNALQMRFRRQIKTWRVSVAVMNHEMAFENGLITGLPN